MSLELKLRLNSITITSHANLMLHFDTKDDELRPIVRSEFPWIVLFRGFIRIAWGSFYAQIGKRAEHNARCLDSVYSCGRGLLKQWPHRNGFLRVLNSFLKEYSEKSRLGRRALVKSAADRQYNQT